MDTFKYQIVRPDKLLSEGDALSVTVITRTGELGILPHHAPEICALGEGVMRINHVPDEGGETITHIVISGGYAGITDEHVIVLADHARNVNDIDPDVVEDTKDDAEDALEELAADDPGRSYFESKIKWCDLLLKVNEKFHAS